MFETILRYSNNSDKPALRSNFNKLDAVIFDAKLVAYQPQGVCARIREIDQDTNLKYYVDPNLGDLREGNNFFNDGDPDEGLRESYLRYIDQLGNPLKRIFQDNYRLQPNHMWEQDIRSIARDTVRFQQEFIPNCVAGRNLGQSPLIDEGFNSRPDAVLPWYHKIQSREDIDVNKVIIEASKIESDLPLRPVVHFERQELMSPFRSDLLQYIQWLDSRSVFIIIERLSKHETSTEEYQTVIDFVNRVAQQGTDPYFLYGDFFANLLSFFGLKGTAYGSMYGEHFEEKTTYSDSNGMSNRFYTTRIRDFLTPQAATDVLQEANEPFCNCDVCSRSFDGWSDFLETADSDKDEDAIQSEMKSHYLKQRWELTRQVEEMELEEVLVILEEDLEMMWGPFYKSAQTGKDASIEYLDRWLTAVKQAAQT